MPSSLKKLSALLALVATVTSAIAGTAPRLWEVKGKDKLGAESKFYILPVTHNGLEVEYDDYFFKKILPIALRADIFLQESAVMVPSEMPPCSQPLADTKENRQILRQAFIDVERAEFDRYPHLARSEIMTDQDWIEVQAAEHWFARDTVAKLSEYGLIAAMGEALNAFLKEQHPEFLRKVDYMPRAEVADFIQDQRRMKGIKSNEPIESARDLAEAYCSINPTQRGRYLQREIGRADPLKFRPMLSDARAKGDEVFSESIQKLTISSRFNFYAADEYDAHVVCDRNEKWLAKMRAGSRGEIRFYAVGMAHVLQPPSQSQNRCDGLLKRLRDEGFSVKLLQ